uniref:Gustatory receptor n=1 Tax=Acrobeloides nanus TaxID=290746 RepID=A0A914DJP1_9BILA
MVCRDSILHVYVWRGYFILIVLLLVYDLPRLVQLLVTDCGKHWHITKTHHTGEGAGSLYLRLGTLFFGSIGIVLFGLEIFMCTSSYQCYTYQLVNLGFACIFTFIQMHFIFCNSKIAFVGSKNLAKLGTMHLLATNLWTWIRFVLAKHAAKMSDHKASTNAGNMTITMERPQLILKISSFDYFGDLATFLATCIVEYSVIGAAIMFVLWRSIDHHHSHRATGTSKRKSKVRIDCRMRLLQYSRVVSSNAEFLDEILLGIGVLGELTHCSTGISCWVAMQSDKDKLETYMLFVFTIRMVQVIIQTIFILLSTRLRALGEKVVDEKPGKQFVTFLLLANVSLFIFHNLEGMKSVFGDAAYNARAR